MKKILLAFVLCILGGSHAFAASEISVRFNNPQKQISTEQSIHAKEMLGFVTNTTIGRAIQLFFLPESITPAEEAELRSGRNLKKEYAYMYLYLNKDNAIWQVDLLYVINGMATGRSVAWTKEALAQFTQNYSFDGSNLKLRSTGASKDPRTYNATDLKWDVDVDVLVDKV